MNRVFRAITIAKNHIKIILGGVLFLAITNIALAQELLPVMQIEPGTNVEVGEEVFFSAAGTNYPEPTILGKARYEWDFGDGYYHRFDPADKTITRSSIAVVHYYMKPGDFIVSLKVSLWTEWDGEGNPIGEPFITETITRTIKVTGVAPIAGFEIQRAPFHNRLAQYLYVQIPEDYRRNITTLKVSLQGSKGSSLILLSKNKLDEEERVFLDQKPLVQDDYVVIAELINSDGQRIPGGLWRDKFSKIYSDIPKVGIDENNAFRLDGELFFPISTFMTRESDFEKFIVQAGINALHTEGYYPTHTPETWSTYLNKADMSNLAAVGPGRGDYFGPTRFYFNHNPERMAEYIQMNKERPAMFAWLWQDEPNLGGRAQKVYPATLAAWSYVSHREDPHHPVYNSFYGYTWTKYYGTGPFTYDYLASAPQFGGKKWMQDVFGFDIYPFQFRLHAALNFTDMGPYAAYMDALDRIHTNNKNLVPVIPTLMPNPRNPGDPLISNEQVYTEAWLNVIHGAKGLTWFPLFDVTNIRYEAMKKFADQMKLLAPAVLQAEPTRTVTDTANAALNRVDTMVREYDGILYVFAARVTEPDPIDKALYRGVEPESINVDFTISGLAGSEKAEVVDEGRQVSINEGQFKDTFERNSVHIYKISNFVDGIPLSAKTPQMLRIVD